MKQISVLLLFYRHYCMAPALVTIACCLLYMLEPQVLPQVATKLFTNAVAMFLIAGLQQDKLYYYYNLHISKRLLFTSYLIADLLIFSACLWLTTLMHQ